MLKHVLVSGRPFPAHHAVVDHESTPVLAFFNHPNVRLDHEWPYAIPNSSKFDVHSLGRVEVRAIGVFDMVHETMPGTKLLDTVFACG